VKRAERTNKVVYETLQTVAARADVRATAHAIRRAFAVNFMRRHPGAIESLQALLGHSRIDTTEAHYLRAFERSERMESVRDLSWSATPGFAHFAPEAAQMQGKAHTGFEPVSEDEPLPEPLRRKLEELRRTSRERDRGSA
jgi:hypothetical protein